jgi:hypothetical protein
MQMKNLSMSNEIPSRSKLLGMDPGTGTIPGEMPYSLHSFGSMSDRAQRNVQGPVGR